MLASPLPLVLTLLLAQKASPQETMKCEEVQRLEFLRTSLAPREVCVSPGLLTELFFEAPISVEIQEESRFEEVSRSRVSVSLVPPNNMAPGERLRLSVRYADGGNRDAVTLMLVAAPGQGTRQVEVFRDTRTRESFEEELKQEREKSLHGAQELARVRIEFERFRQQHGDSHQLRWLIASGALTSDGIRTRAFEHSWEERHVNSLIVRTGVTYRSMDRLAIAIWLVNSSPHPWWARFAQIQGGDQNQFAVDVWQQGGAVGSAPFLLILEADGRMFDQVGEVTVTIVNQTREQLILSGIKLP